MQGRVIRCKAGHLHLLIPNAVETLLPAWSAKDIALDGHTHHFVPKARYLADMRPDVRKIQTFASFEEMERATLCMLDELTDEEKVDRFFQKRREWLFMLGENPDALVRERKVVVGRHWLQTI